MRLLLLFLLLWCGITAAAQRPVAADGLRALQDSVWRYMAAHRNDDPLPDAVYASWIDERQGCVEVHLVLADSATKALFRSRVHDSPHIRLTGFDPATTPFAPAPAGATPPDGIVMDPQYALYPTGTDRVRLTIRHRGGSAVFFGTDYTLCRFRHGRWEVLPVCNAWNSLLIGLGVPERPTAAGADSPTAGTQTYVFEAWLAPRLFPAIFGRYRVCKKVYTENPRRDYLLTAEFTVTPFVPFTRFTE